MKVIKTYDSYNPRRFGRPWVAKVNKDTTKDFQTRIGGYTGSHGEGGQLYINKPIEGQVYAYGQKDYRNSRGPSYTYIKYCNGIFVDISTSDLLQELGVADD